MPRCFTFHGSVLCYYECEDFEDADPSRPRGRIDLIRDETKASYVDMQKPGAPTQYLIVLQIFVLGGIERKWKMCANSKSQQQRWFEGEELGAKDKERNDKALRIYECTICDLLRFLLSRRCRFLVGVALSSLTNIVRRSPEAVRRAAHS